MKNHSGDFGRFLSMSLLQNRCNRLNLDGMPELTTNWTFESMHPIGMIIETEAPLSAVGTLLRHLCGPPDREDDRLVSYNGITAGCVIVAKEQEQANGVEISIRTISGSPPNRFG